MEEIGGSMYIIGIIDDEIKQVATIKRTIKTNAPQDEKYDFKAYELPEDSGQLVDCVYTEVMDDIVMQKISCLIIDYKIMVRTTKIKGTDIFGKIKERVPKFPVIILTERVNESIEPIFIDADKVYSKTDFFKLRDDYSKEKVRNIFDSMRKYTDQKDSLQLRLSESKRKLSNNSGVEEGIREVLQIESILDDFIPTNQTQIDKVFDEQKAKSIVELIEKANSMLD